ncbi:MAG: ParB/RepB/Spo0J family partition protein [Anaerolineae bacterium]
MARPRRGLGRGLEALIPAPTPRVTEGLMEVEVERIEPNPLQPRHSMDPEALQELADSIREHGLIQPLIVTEAGEGYQLIAGERRWAAAKLAGLSKVPVIVKEATPREMLELALVENLQRADLNPLEAAGAYRQLIDDFGLTQEEVATRVGKNRATVANTLRLLRLPDQVKRLLAEGRISEGHARALLSLETPKAQIDAAGTILRRGLSVRQTEEMVRRLTAPVQPKPVGEPLSPETRALEDKFRQALGTKVQLFRSKRGGRLVIHFYSEEELQGLYELIVGE